MAKQKQEQVEEAEPTRFDGYLVVTREFELGAKPGGGGYETTKHIKDNDIVSLAIRAKCVNVKHPPVEGGVVRKSTLQIQEAHIVDVEEAQIVEQPTLEDADPGPTEPDDDE